MSNLITVTDIRVYKPVAESIDTSMKVDTFISEAQEFDLRPLLGDPFYLQILSAAPDFADPNLSDLFNGSTYTYDGKSYQHDGLKSVLCYYSYARYKNESNVNDTAFGTVFKTNSDSERVDDKVIQRQVNQSMSGASAYWSRTLDFILRNSTNYPLFDCGTDAKKGSIRITNVRK